MDDVWVNHIAQLRDSEKSRALGMTFALATEVFALKAEVKRLRLALHAQGSLSTETELDAGEGEAFAKWLLREQSQFAKHLMKGWVETDQSPDVSAQMEVAGSA